MEACLKMNTVMNEKKLPKWSFSFFCGVSVTLLGLISSSCATKTKGLPSKDGIIKCDQCSYIKVVGKLEDFQVKDNMLDKNIILNINALTIYNEQDFNKLVDIHEKYTVSLLRPSQDPYFGRYDKLQVCLDSFLRDKSISETKLSKIITYKLPASRNFQYGVCDLKANFFMSELQYLFCKNNSKGYQIKTFWTVNTKYKWQLNVEELCHENDI